MLAITPVPRGRRLNPTRVWNTTYPNPRVPLALSGASSGAMVAVLGLCYGVLAGIERILGMQFRNRRDKEVIHIPFPRGMRLTLENKIYWDIEQEVRFISNVR